MLGQPKIPLNVYTAYEINHFYKKLSKMCILSQHCALSLIWNVKSRSQPVVACSKSTICVTCSKFAIKKQEQRY